MSDTNCEYPIESGVPIAPRKAAGRNPIYPFRKMEVGDSFVVPCDGVKPAVVSNRVRVAARYHAMAYGKKFITRTMDDGVRVWRVE